MSYPQPEMGSGASPEIIRLLRNGFNQLKEGSLYMIIGTLLTALGFLAITPAITGRGLAIPHHGITLAPAGGAFTLLLALIGEIIVLLGLVRWKHGGEYFKQVDPSGLSGGESGPKYMIWGVAIIVLALLIMIPAVMNESVRLALLGITVGAIGGLIYLIGYILFGIFLLRIEDLKRRGIEVPDFKVDAILWFIGIVANILTFIAVILIYLHSKEVEEKLGMVSASYRPPPEPSF